MDPVDIAGGDGGRRAHNAFTGVLREYRGRGLARALKVLATEEARQQGRRWISTMNNARNTAMLAINSSLGYERQPGLWFLRKTLRPGGSETV